MKKIFFAAAISLALASCGDDDSNATSNVSIEGQWKLTAVTLDQAYDLDNDNIQSTNLISETGCFNNSTITFAGGIAVFDLEDVDITINSTATGDAIAVDCIDDEVGPLPYAIGNNQVVLGTGEDQFTMQRNGNTLTVHFDQGTTIPVMAGGNISYTDVGTTFVFTKQ